MPLRFEFYNEIHHKDGSIVIDRNNFVINFGLIKDSYPNQLVTVALGKVFDSLIGMKIVEVRNKMGLQKNIDINAKTHVITDHVCETDKMYHHTHIVFNKSIDADLMKQIIGAAPESDWLQVMDKDSYYMMIEITAAYFIEQEQDFSLEQAYKREKLQALLSAIESAPVSKTYSLFPPHKAAPLPTDLEYSNTPSTV